MSEASIFSSIEKKIAYHMKEGDGAWVTCTGCHDTFEGYATGDYPYSTVFKCDLGSGCAECGGIGAVWDNTDYSDLGDFLKETMKV